MMSQRLKGALPPQRPRKPEAGVVSELESDRMDGCFAGVFLLE